MGFLSDSEILKDVVRYGRQDLEVACEDFSNIIGSSPDSVVYKGTMKSGPEIAVISLCIKEEHWTGYLELYFQREVTAIITAKNCSLKHLTKNTITECKIWQFNHVQNNYLTWNAIQVADLARLNHENTGKLLGYCKESTPFTRMLVFEYASNGTLYEYLHCKSNFVIAMFVYFNLLHWKFILLRASPTQTLSIYLLLQMEKHANFLGLGVWKLLLALHVDSSIFTQNLSHHLPYQSWILVPFILQKIFPPRHVPSLFFFNLFFLLWHNEYLFPLLNAMVNQWTIFLFVRIIIFVTVYPFFR